MKIAMLNRAVMDRLDKATVAELFRAHGAMVFRRAYRILGRREDAEEATHEVFIRVLHAGDRFEARAGVTTWLYQITTNYCLNQLRDRRRRRELFAANVAAPTGDAAGADAADLLLLRRLLAEADEQQARAATYVLLDGMSQEEAASVLGVSQRTVSNLIDRFLRWARERATDEAGAAPARETRG